MLGINIIQGARLRRRLLQRLITYIRQPLYPLILISLQQLKRILPYKAGSSVQNITKPKYNYKPVDLDRNLKALQLYKDFSFIYPRILFQFYFILLSFYYSRARRNALLKLRVKYKVRNNIQARTISTNYSRIFNLFYVERLKEIQSSSLKQTNNILRIIETQRI